MIDELYSARILKLAANLPHSGRLAAPEGTGERVARLCGSKAIVDVTLDDAGRVETFAQRYAFEELVWPGNAAPFLNVNTPAELSEAMRRLERVR